MRFAELAFLGFLVLYHVFLLAPRHRRPFPANYLIFLAGMALAWNLGLEGLRWQTLPPTLLLLVDLAVLFPSFASLRGNLPRPGFWSGLLGVLRTTVASVAFLASVGGVLLAVAFPLPRVELTGGLAPSYRVVRFPPTAERQGMEVRLWYPSSGDSHPLPRPAAESDTWQAVRTNGGLPVFWQSYWEYLPTSLVKGGKLASPGTKYPVVSVAVPRGQDPGDFGYLFEDLASRGFVVAAALPIPGAGPGSAPFRWSTALSDLLQPFRQPTLWFEPDLTLGRVQSPTDYRWMGPLQRALKQLDSEPGDLLFSSIDWGRQGLWVWGYGASLAAADQKALGITAVVHAGGPPPAAHSVVGKELWMVGGTVAGKPSTGEWYLTVPRLARADLTDAAYLKPGLAFFGVKSQADAGFHGVLRQYQAAFYQYAFWGETLGTGFVQTVPQVPGLTLTGQ